MTVPIKTPEDIEKMRVVGRMAAQTLEMIGPYVKPGVTTEYLDKVCHDYIVHTLKAIPAPLNYHGFPKSICTSVNQQVCHGIPSDRVLVEGDSLNIDVTVLYDGFHGDTSAMFAVGSISPQAERLIKTTYECMWAGIRTLKAGTRLGDIGAAIQTIAHAKHYSVVREYCGHGIGRVFHEDPQVLHYGQAGTGLALKAGMVITIEPMINAGGRDVRLLKDQWTVVTKDRSLSAQWEHTILITETGYEVLTLRTDEANK
ncbi:MAG: type I methionyl aminopeptidase [Pseudomonadota bacterium]